MPSGVVKWFNDAKGWGFIEPDGGGPDAFAHFSAIVMEGYKTLKEGSRVDFDLTQGPKGLQAVNIRASGQPTAGDAALLDTPLHEPSQQGLQGPQDPAAPA